MLAAHTSARLLLFDTLAQSGVFSIVNCPVVVLPGFNAQPDISAFMHCFVVALSVFLRSPNLER